MSDEAERDRILAGPSASVTELAGTNALLLLQLCEQLRALVERQAALKPLAQELKVVEEREWAEQRAKRVESARVEIQKLLEDKEVSEGLRKTFESSKGLTDSDWLRWAEQWAEQAPAKIRKEVEQLEEGWEEPSRLEAWDQRRDKGEFFAARMLSAPSSLPSDSATTRSVSEQKRFDALVGELGRLELSTAKAEELVRLMENPGNGWVRKFMRRALGFAIARYHADHSGRVLRYVDVAVGGLDARALLGQLLVDNPPCQWDLPKGSHARVVSVTPAELAEQVSTSAYSDLRSAFSLALEGLFRGTVASTNAAFERVSRELRQYDLIGRNPLLVGFVGGDSRPGIASNSFGWIVSPRLEASTAGKAKLRYRQASSRHSVSATLIAPAGLTELPLHYRVFRIEDTGEWLESRSLPGPMEHVRSSPFPAGSVPRARCRKENQLTLQLPSSPEVLAQGVMAANRAGVGQPKILAARPPKRADEAQTDALERRALWRIQAKEKVGLAILGQNLWRNPQVYVGGQRATRVQIMSDLGGLWAEFDEVRVPAGQDGAPVAVDLVVSTSRGTDRLLEGVEILPAKADAKPPEPRFGPALQAVVPVITATGGKETARFALRFELVPPLPRVRQELLLRVKPRGAAGYATDLRVSDAQVIVPDPKKPGNFEIRDLVLEKATPWDALEPLELMLQVRETGTGDLRSVHSSPIEATLVRMPIACDATPRAVPVEKVNERWLVAADTTVKLAVTSPGAALPPRVAEDLLPQMKPGVEVAARVVIGGLAGPCRVAAKEGEVGRVWTLFVPKGTVVAASATLPNPAPAVEVEHGDAKWRVTLDFQPKP